MFRNEQMLVERIFSGVMLVVTLILISMAWGYTAPVSYDPIGPRPYPMLILCLLALGTASIAFRPAKFMDIIDMGWTKPIVKNLVLCTVAMTVYAVLFEWLGYILATFIMAWSIGMLFGGQKVKTAISSIVMAVLTYLLFDKALDVSLPLGLLSFLNN